MAKFIFALGGLGELRIRAEGFFNRVGVTGCPSPPHTTRHAGVPRYRSPFGQPLGWLVQWVEHDVGQQGRKRTALRHAERRGLTAAVGQLDSRTQIAPNQPEQLSASSGDGSGAGERNVRWRNQNPCRLSRPAIGIGTLESAVADLAAGKDFYDRQEIGSVNIFMTACFPTSIHE